jgi:hypothetical protein
MRLTIFLLASVLIAECSAQTIQLSCSGPCGTGNSSSSCGYEFLRSIDGGKTYASLNRDANGNLSAATECAWTDSGTPLSYGEIVSYYVTMVDPYNPSPKVISNLTTMVIEPGNTGINSNLYGLEFFPLNSCRLVDTRYGNGPLAGPSLNGANNGIRSFPILSGSCGIPATAQVYSLTITALPQTTSPMYITAWPTGQTQPGTSVVNAAGASAANKAFVEPGTNGAISIYASYPADVLIDVDGYFAPGP